MAGGRKPVIGVTGPDKGGLVAWLFAALAIRRAGGKPRRLRPGMWREMPELDGLVIGGGADVSPELYGAEELQNLRDLSEENKKKWTRFLFFFCELRDYAGAKTLQFGSYRGARSGTGCA